MAGSTAKITNNKQRKVRVKMLGLGDRRQPKGTREETEGGKGSKLRKMGDGRKQHCKK